MTAVETLAPLVGLVLACAALAVSRAAVYRRLGRVPSRALARPTPARALSSLEEQEVLAVLHSERFLDVAPAEIVHTLLDDDQTYLCSTRTMYRILEKNAEVRERRDQLRHPVYSKPELLATGPNQVWSWDITKLLGPEKWTYFYLYVVLDIFSRKVVGWMLAMKESAGLAKRLIRESCVREDIEPDQLTIHSDRGSPMKSKTVAQLFADLEITRSLSRPHVSDDNPFSESQFKTMKYRPEFPDRFSSFDEALAFCREFFPWYNGEHRHSGIAFMTPADVHHGRAAEVTEMRQQALTRAFEAHPERFVHGPPRAEMPPSKVYINPPQANGDASQPVLHSVSRPTDAQLGLHPKDETTSVDMTVARALAAATEIAADDAEVGSSLEMQILLHSDAESVATPPCPSRVPAERAELEVIH